MKLDLMCDYAICNQTERCAGYNTRVGICNPILLLLVCPAEERGKKGEREGKGDGFNANTQYQRGGEQRYMLEICFY